MRRRATCLLLVVTAILAASPTAEAALSPLGEQRTLVIPFNFLDDTSEPFTPQQISDHVNDETDPASIDAYIREVSYGQAFLNADVLDWTTAPVDAADCFPLLNPNGNIAAALELVAPVVDLTLYDRFLIVAVGGTGCLLGISTLGAKTIDTSQGQLEASVAAATTGPTIPSSYVRALTHELGHSLELYHAHDLECGPDAVGDAPPCNVDGTVGNGRNHFSLLGQSGIRGHWDVVQKEYLGWLHADRIAIVAAGQAQLALDPIELPSSGAQAIKLPASYDLQQEFTNTTSHYYVSYRQPIGLDAVFPELSDPDTGLLLHLDMDPAAISVGMASALVDTTPHATSPELSAFEDSLDVAMTLGDVYVDALHEIFVRFDAVQAGQALVSTGSVYTNLIANGSFAEDIAGWTNLLLSTWSSLDAAGSPYSGSLRGALDPPLALEIRSSCTPIVAGLDYDFRAAYLIPAGQEAGHGQLIVRWWSAPSCTGLIQTDGLSATNVGAWTQLAGTATAPATAVSATLGVIVSSAVEASEFVVYYDDAQLVARLADAIGQDLSGQSLAGADLRFTQLAAADLSGADLRGADLHGSNLLGANLLGASLAGADLSDVENLADAVSGTSTLYSASTDFTGTGFDPVAAGWTLLGPTIPALGPAGLVLLAAAIAVATRKARTG